MATGKERSGQPPDWSHRKLVTFRPIRKWLRSWEPFPMGEGITFLSLGVFWRVFAGVFLWDNGRREASQQESWWWLLLPLGLTLLNFGALYIIGHPSRFPKLARILTVRKEDL